MSEVECFSCGIKGHYASKCPHKLDKDKSKSDSEDDGIEAAGHVTWTEVNDYCTFSTYQVLAASDGGFSRTQVLIDNQVDISGVHPSLLQNIMPAE